MRTKKISLTILLISLTLLTVSSCDDKNEDLSPVNNDDTSEQKGTYPKAEKIFVEGGSFIMGTPEGNRGTLDERPKHTVNLNSFYIGKYEVTNKQYAEFLTAKKVTEKKLKEWLHINPTFINTVGNSYEIEKTGDTYQAKASRGNFPVQVTWFGAKAYAEWVGGRLPTEAEWEYAARGGNKNTSENGKYQYSGTDKLEEFNNVAWNKYNSGDEDNYNLKRKEVGTKQANELGIHDMSGNLWEWCNDWYDSGYYKKSPIDNPKGADSGQERVIRGGSYYYEEYDCRVNNRRKAPAKGNYYCVGFRVVFDK